MIIEQIYTKCLAQGAYYIESDGEAAVIDPLRAPSPYIERAKKNMAKVKYVFETHIHADFVSGHIDLAKKTGATIVFGPNAKTQYDCHNAVDGEVFKIGKLCLKVIHTPGHTLESVSYLLIDAAGNNHALFSGDTLFIQGCGRVDLPGSNSEDMFHSLRKLSKLPDETIIYPGHNYGPKESESLEKVKEINSYLRIEELELWKQIM